MNIDEAINGWTFEETIKTAENLMEAEKNMFTWDVIRHLRDFAELYREKLKEYEDLEGQGLLLRLPCKVGTKVYAINIIIDYGEIGDEATYSYSIIEREFQIYMMMDYGKLVFLTQAEAEAKLEELRGKQNDGE